MPLGPQPYPQSQRAERVQSIFSRFQSYYGAHLLAAALYGSTARGTDGPYSDIEIHLILKGRKIDERFEWSEGPWKAEVDVYSKDVILAQAAEMDEFWPLTHGCFVYLQPLHDPRKLFPAVARAALEHSDAEFEDLIREVIVGDIYECIGKLRNAVALNQLHIIPSYLVDTARYGACLMGLAHRRLYAGGSAALYPESLELPGRPAGYDELCRMVMRGDLSDPARSLSTADAYWDGLEAWAAARGLKLHTPLDALLQSGKEA